MPLGVLLGIGTRLAVDGQFLAVQEALAADLADGGGDRDLLQRLAVTEGAIAQMRTALGDLDGAQVRAGAEGAVVDYSDRGGVLTVFSLFVL